MIAHGKTDSNKQHGLDKESLKIEIRESLNSIDRSGLAPCYTVNRIIDDQIFILRNGILKTEVTYLEKQKYQYTQLDEQCGMVAACAVCPEHDSTRRRSTCDAGLRVFWQWRSPQTPGEEKKS